MAGKKKKEDSTVEHVQTAVEKGYLPGLEAIGDKLTDMEMIERSSRYATFRWSIETIARILKDGAVLDDLHVIGKWLVTQGEIDQNKPELVLDWSLKTIIDKFLDPAKNNIPIKR